MSEKKKSPDQPQMPREVSMIKFHTAILCGPDTNVVFKRDQYSIQIGPDQVVRIRHKTKPGNAQTHIMNAAFWVEHEEVQG